MKQAFILIRMKVHQLTEASVKYVKRDDARKQCWVYSLLETCNVSARGYEECVVSGSCVYVAVLARYMF